MLISGVQQSDPVMRTDTHTHTHTFFFVFFSIMVYHRILSIVPLLCSMALLFIHSVYNSMHLLIPHSQSFPPPPPGNHEPVLYVCESVSSITSFEESRLKKLANYILVIKFFFLLWIMLLVLYLRNLCPTQSYKDFIFLRIKLDSTNCLLKLL